MLTVQDLHAYYGKSHILQGVDLAIGEGEIVSLLGRNGVGRSTTCKAIMGLVAPQGAVTFKGQPIAGRRPDQIAHAGIGYVPEDRQVFPSLTVRQNLELGLKRAGTFGRWNFEDVYRLFPNLGERRDNPAGVLSGGEQQMLAIGRAMMSRPKLLMLDEPSMGLSPIMMQRIFSVIGELQEQGTTILLVEQNAQAALSLADHGYVIETGRIAFDGPGRDLLGDERVRKAYLGED